MERDEDNGKDSISDLINEVTDEIGSATGEGLEEDGDILAGETAFGAKRRWKRSWILSRGGQ